MKIIFFSNSAKNLFNFRKNLILNFKNKHNTIYLIFQNEKNNIYYRDYFVNKGFKIKEIYLSRHSFNPIKELITFFQIIRIYVKIKPQIAFHFTIKPNIYGSIAANINKIKCVNNVTGLGFFFFNKGFKKYILKLLYKISIKFSEHTFFQNKEDAKYFYLNNLVKKNNYSILPGSGIDLKYYKFKEFPKNKITKILYVGRLIREKGIVELLNAATLIKKNNIKCNLYILGNIDDDNESNISMSTIKHYHENNIINYLGEMNDIRPILNKMDAVILPTYREGISHALLEACSVGRPIISTKISGNKDILVNNHNGVLFQPRSVKSIVNAIKKFTNYSYNKKKNLGKNARKLVSTKFDEKIIINNYNSVVKKIFT